MSESLAGILGFVLGGIVGLLFGLKMKEGENGS